MTFSTWLQGLRGTRSQAEVAEAAGLSLTQSRLSEFEHGIRLPTFRQLVAILDACGADFANRTAGESLWKAAVLAEAPRHEPEAA